MRLDHILKFNPHHDKLGRFTTGASSQTQTPEFKAWFGDSKVVDANGNPKVVYHGTTKDFDTFEQGHKTTSEDIGFHFGEDPEQSVDIISDREFWLKDRPDTPKDWGLQFAIGRRDSMVHGKALLKPSANIMPVYLSIKNPLRIPDADNTYISTSFADTLQGMGVITKEQYREIGTLVYEVNRKGGAGYNEGTKALRKILEDKGYDGLVYANEYEGNKGEAWVAFRPEQIKSAVGNNGDFDPKNPKIHKFDQILKYNKNHDKLGRFATGSEAKVGGVENYLDELWTSTTDNPFDNRERIHNYTSGLEVYPFDGGVHISSIRSFNKGEGAGSAALKHLTSLADKHGVELTLTPKPFGTGTKGLNAKKLKEWYGRHGFKDNRSRGMWVRQPVTQKFEEVLKYNPYHDKLGRFTNYVYAESRMAVWHGTSKHVLDAILKEGIKFMPSGKRVWDDNYYETKDSQGVYVSTDKSLAERFALRAANAHKTGNPHDKEAGLEEAVLIRLRVPAKVAKSFKKDVHIYTTDEAFMSPTNLKPEWIQGAVDGNGNVLYQNPRKLAEELVDLYVVIAVDGEETSQKFDHILKYNPNHEPAGSSKGGQFAKKPSGGDLEQEFMTASWDDLGDKMLEVKVAMSAQSAEHYQQMNSYGYPPSKYTTQEEQRRIRVLMYGVYSARKQLHQDFGIDPVKGGFLYLHTSQAFMDSGALGKGVIGRMDMALATKGVDENYMNDIAKSTEGREIVHIASYVPISKLVREGNHKQAVNEFVQSLVRHELAHNYTDVIISAKSLDVMEMNVKELPDNMWDATPIAEKVSAYATTNHYEFAAEVFAKYTNPSYQKGSMSESMEQLAQDIIKSARGD